MRQPFLRLFYMLIKLELFHKRLNGLYSFYV